MQFKETIAVNSKKHKKPINSVGKTQLLNGKVGGTFSKHCGLKT
jgi:hypothetical protein